MARIFDLAKEAYRRGQNQDWFTEEVFTIPRDQMVEDAWASLHLLLTETNIPTKVFHFVHGISDMILEPRNIQQEQVNPEEFRRKSLLFKAVALICAENTPFGTARADLYRFASLYTSFTANSESEFREALAILDRALTAGVEEFSAEWNQCLIDKGNVYRNGFHKWVMPQETVWEALEIFEEARKYAIGERKAHVCEACARLLLQAVTNLGDSEMLREKLGNLENDFKWSQEELDNAMECRQILADVYVKLRLIEAKEWNEREERPDPIISAYISKGFNIFQDFMKDQSQIEKVPQALENYLLALDLSQPGSRERCDILSYLGDVYFYYSKIENEHEMLLKSIDCVQRARQEGLPRGTWWANCLCVEADGLLALAKLQIDPINNLLAADKICYQAYDECLIGLPVYVQLLQTHAMICITLADKNIERVLNFHSAIMRYMDIVREAWAATPEQIDSAKRNIELIENALKPPNTGVTS